MPLCAAAGLLLLAAGCGRPAREPTARAPAYPGPAPRAGVVNESGSALGSVVVFGSHGPLAPAADRLAPGDSATFSLEVKGEDAVFVSFVAEGRAVVSADSAYVEGPGGYAVRFVVDSTLTARAAGTTIGR